MNRESQADLSYWERSTFFKKKDVIIVGAGIVGLSAALAYKKARPAEEVLIIDRELFPKGASSRNAGFACFGSMTELLADELATGEETMLQLVARRWRGLAQLRQLIGDEQMDYLGCGGFEVFTPKQVEIFEKAQGQLARINGLLAPVVGHDRTFSPLKNPETIGLDSKIKVIRNMLEGQLNPGKMTQHLIALNLAAGVEIRRGHELKDWVETESGISLNFAGDIQLSSRQVLLATNGFTQRLFSELEVEPARNHVFITDPIPGLRLNGTFHAEEGYLYFRNVENRLLIGGGRHWDKKNSVTDQYGNNEAIRQRLLTYAYEVINLEKQSINIAQSWSGILGVGPTKQPILERKSKKMVIAVRLGGMGVAIGAGVGTRAAELLLE